MHMTCSGSASILSPQNITDYKSDDCGFIGREIFPTDRTLTISVPRF